MTARRVVVAGPLVTSSATGSAIHLQELMRAIMEDRPDADVVLRHMSRKGPAANLASAERIHPQVGAVTTRLPASLLRSAQNLVRLPRERWLVGPYDVYHQFHTDCDPAVPDRRLIVTLHDTVALDWPESEGTMFRGAGHLLRRAAAVITVSEHSKKAICQAFSVAESQVHVVTNGVDHDRFVEDPPARERIVPGPYLVFVGGHTPRKNVRRIVEAFASIRPRFPDLTLILAGPVIFRATELRAAAPSVPSDAIHFPGYLPDALTPRLYADAEALVYPSLAEGFGMPILEAMACGTPVLTSDRGATREVAGTAGLLVDPESVSSIATGMEGLLCASAQERAVRRQAGLTRSQEFRWSDAARRMLRVYDGVSG